MTRLVLATVLLFLAACSAATRYTFQVDVLSLIPEDQRSFDINAPSSPCPSSCQVQIPTDPAGQLVSLPVSLDILERAEISIKGSLKNTNNTNTGNALSGSYEIRLAPKDDDNITDGNKDVVLDSTNFSVDAGRERSIPITVRLSASESSTAFNIIKSGSFRIAIRVNVNSSNGGSFKLTEAQVKVTGRPFALIR